MRRGVNSRGADWLWAAPTLVPGIPVRNNGDGVRAKSRRPKEEKKKKEKKRDRWRREEGEKPRAICPPRVSPLQTFPISRFSRFSAGPVKTILAQRLNRNLQRNLLDKASPPPPPPLRPLPPPPPPHHHCNGTPPLPLTIAFANPLSQPPYVSPYGPK